jgi:hypothetical protein
VFWLAIANLNTLSNILKEYYQGPVVEQLNKEVLLLSRLESKSEDLVGKRAYVPLVAARTTGIGARAENATLPSAGAYSYERAVYDLKYLYGKTAVTGPSMAKTNTDAGSFLEVLRSELDGLRMDLQKDLARQIYGNGSGVIATVVSGNAGGTTAVVSKEVLNKGQLYTGMTINIRDASAAAGAGADLGSPATTFTITAVDTSTSATTGTITITPAAGVQLASGDTIRRAGVKQYAEAENPAYTNDDPTNPGTFATSDEVDGLARIVSATATLGGIDPTAAGKEWWKAQVVAAADRKGTARETVLKDLLLDDIQIALNKARTAGGYPTAIVTSLGIQREFYKLLEDQVRYVEPENLSYAAGFKTLSYNGMPLIADIDAPYGKMHILDESTMKVYSDQDWHFLDNDGQTLRQAGDKDAFEAVMVRYMNLGATRRNNQIVITDIAVDQTFDQGF